VAEIESDVLIVGGGLGGVAAALAAARHGHRVVLTEVTDWLGGQLTQQAVPPDEHPYIEQFGCTRTYRLLRHRIRELYRAYYPLTREARSDPHLNPGNGWVSGLCHEPRVALLAIESLLMPLQSSGLLRVLLHHEPIDAETDGDRVLSVRLQDCNGGEDVVACAPLMLDATETGELLSLTKTEYVTGAESRSETAEPHASHERRQLNMQAITFCFAIDHLYGEDHTIDRPERYGFWRSYKAPFWPGRQLGLNSPEPQTLEPLEHTFTPNPNLQDGRRGPASKELWLFRRIADRANFAPGRYKSDITLVNWPMIDYFDGPILDVPQQEASRHLDDARQLSLSSSTGCRPRHRDRTVARATQVCACAPTSSVPKTGWPNTPISVSLAGYEPSTPLWSRTLQLKCAAMPGPFCTPTVSVSAAIGSTCIPLREETTTSTFLPVHLSYPWVHCCRCVSGTSSRHPRTSGPLMSPMGVTGFIRLSGTSARRRGCSVRTVCRGRLTPIRCGSRRGISKTFARYSSGKA